METNQEILIQAIRDNPVRIGWLCGFNDLGDLHNDWIRTMMFSERDETLLGHRGSYKTTCLSIAIALLIVFFPNVSIMFIRKTDDDVKEVVNQVAKVLNSDFMRYIVNQIYGVYLEVSHTAFMINTNLNTQPRGMSQLLGCGTGGSLTGKHADIIFTDDIVNVKDRVSRSERERIKLLYMELQNIKNRGGRIFNTGTPWHKEDCISTIMPNVQRYDCYSTGLISKEKLIDLRKSMSDSLFAANYELKHIADKDAIFKDPKFVTDADVKKLIEGGSSHVDAAYDGSDGTAFTIMNKLKDGRIFALGKRWSGHVDDHVDEIKAIHDFYKAGSISCEKNADKGYLAKELKGMGMYTHLYSEHMNKFIKISTYLRSNWENIYWLEETDPEYMNEILDYTEHAEHDDSPDSAASLLVQMDAKPKYNAVTGGI